MASNGGSELPEDDVAVVRMALDAFSCSGRDDELADRATNAFYRLTHGLGPDSDLVDALRAIRERTNW